MGAAASSALTGLRHALPASAQSRAAWLWAAALGLAAAAALGAAAWSTTGRRWRRWRRGPRQLRQVGTVAQIWIYPIKSCKGVIVNEVECTEMGLRSGNLRDRFWLVTKEDGHMVTARQEPRLVLINIMWDNDQMTLSAPDMNDLVVPRKLSSTNAIRDCRIFGVDIQGRDCGDEVGQWITSFLKTETFRLVQFETHMAGRKSKEICHPSVQNYEVAYPDCCPVMMLSEASLSDLNTRLEKKLKMEQFRPNIVVTGCSAFEEDTWDEILIGSVEMNKVLACPRCIMITVDPDTGIITRKEPLETLKSYRLCDPAEKHLYKSDPLFGMYFSVEKIGSLKVGDPVYLMTQ
ncbi:mitochondrial amidoxime reducing component 2-like [Vombatus ursinus]|uniref:Mitochondrial amidoxime reducing component 2 n=1 Tax=Vombatus ursinus TaxID=29139 RepID=A0A4X2KLC2_VOMUR|nr:mitochondrial amidoxime reducing component 2-like [Vombatus ursinus]XP_027726577.1 mitochondrial amidoxime reducing component 2-like [Vombatus ursinus]XP_027726578.1 mitochondrial amidoxime reducing component 2-like [Vombatus ursinus]XP_027726579.1 mitochondrial amidoxime reducing component 2-like [Vombatus ursinus]